MTAPTCSSSPPTASFRTTFTAPLRTPAQVRQTARMMDANRGEATRCLEMAEAALSLNEFDRAERLVAKSERMFPLPEQSEARARILALRKTRPTATGVPKKRKPAASQPAAPSVTPEMIELVQATNAASSRGPYAVLGVPKDASDAVIKRAYRRLVLRLHPDKNFAPEAEDAFKAVARAFEILSDPQRRQIYDRTGEDPDEELPQAPMRRQYHPHFRRRARRGFSEDEFQFIFEQFERDFDGDHVFMRRAHNRDADGGGVQPMGSIPAVFLMFAIFFAFSIFSSMLNSFLLFLESMAGA